MPFTQAFKQQLLTNIFSGKSLGLGTGEETEVSGQGYSRISAAQANFSVSGSTIRNMSKIRFDEALGSGGFGTVTHLLVRSTDGITFFIPLTTPLTVNQDYMVKFDSQAITVTATE